MKKILFVICILTSAILAMAAVAETASAAVVTLSLDDFTIFSNTGTDIAGANFVYGNIGSNQNLAITAGDTQILGSAYAGGTFSTGQDVKIGSDGITPGPAQEFPPFNLAPVYPALTAQVVANGTATLGGTNTIYGTLDALSATMPITSVVTGGTTTGASADTFGSITMTSGIGFTATGGPVAVSGTTIATPLVLPPGPSTTYGALSAIQGQAVQLSSGDYNFSSITASGTFTLKIDLSSGQPVNINVVGDATFGQDAVLMVKGAGTGGAFVNISDAPQLASLIHWTLGGTFDLGGGDANTWTTIFGGIVNSHFSGTGDGIVIDQHVDWYGALYAYDTIDLADHSRYNFDKATSNPVPEPSTMLLLGSGLMGLAGYGRKRFKK